MTRGGEDDHVGRRAAVLKLKRTAASFYGRPASGVGAAVAECSNKRSHSFEDTAWAALVDKIRSSSKHNNPFLIWREFSTQDSAFKYADSSVAPICIFSFEFDRQNPGKRRFVASTYHAFFAKYYEMSPEHQVFYELIREETPCRLYFDLEYKTAANPLRCATEMMRVFKTLIIKEVYEVFRIRITSRDMVDLTSTTSEKFSRHLIVHIPNAVWKDNSHVGRFVSRLCFKIRLRVRELQSKELSSLSIAEATELAELLELFVNADKPLLNNAVPALLFVDEGVYTRNRNFRIYLSAKIGKSARLLPAEECGFYRRETAQLDTVKICSSNRSGKANTNISHRAKEESYFRDSLVCAVQWREGMRILSYSGLQAGNVSKDMPQPPPSLSFHVRSAASKFPEIDSFLVQWISSNTNASSSASISIKSVSCFPETLVYNVAGSRFCFRMGREHKSNGVYYVVELNRGVFTQRCHDPDCLRYRSSEVELPLTILKQP